MTDDRADRRNPAPRARSGAGSASGPGANRPPDTRKRRPPEQRYAGWGDGLDRVACASAIHLLTRGFPPEPRGNLATIAPAVVARRDDTLLICNYAHCGPHIWPDGEIVAEFAADATESPAG